MRRMKISVIIPVKGQTEVLLKNLKDKVIPYFDSRKGITYDVLIAPNGSSEEEQKALLEGVKGLPAQIKVLPLIGGIHPAHHKDEYCYQREHRESIYFYNDGLAPDKTIVSKEKSSQKTAKHTDALKHFGRYLFEIFH